MGKVAKGLGNALLLGIPGKIIRGQKRAEQAAKNEGNAQRQMIEQHQAQIRGEQARLEQNIAGAQAKVNIGQARANRRRIRGGIFGDNLQQQQPQGILNARLG
jgi:hypothetical protein